MIGGVQVSSNFGMADPIAPDVTIVTPLVPPVANSIDDGWVPLGRSGVVTVTVRVARSTAKTPDPV